jgi:hypothetical protein
VSVTEGTAVGSPGFDRLLVLPTDSIQWMVLQALRSFSLAVSTDSHRPPTATDMKAIVPDK